MKAIRTVMNTMKTYYVQGIVIGMMKNTIVKNCIVPLRNLRLE